jgi:hypothetical protein
LCPESKRRPEDGMCNHSTMIVRHETRFQRSPVLLSALVPGLKPRAHMKRASGAESANAYIMLSRHSSVSNQAQRTSTPHRRISPAQQRQPGREQLPGPQCQRHVS